MSLRSIGKVTIVIYSKTNCPFCVKAKQLLKEKNIDYREKNIKDPEVRQELLVIYPEAKTVPQIFIDSQHIGGYQELVKYLEKQH